MDPNDAAGKTQGNTVKKILTKRFLFKKCKELPVFLDVDITASHVERVAHKLSGGAEPSGFNSGQLQDLL